MRRVEVVRSQGIHLLTAVGIPRWQTLHWLLLMLILLLLSCLHEILWVLLLIVHLLVRRLHDCLLLTRGRDSVALRTASSQGICLRRCSVVCTRCCSSDCLLLRQMTGLRALWEHGGCLWLYRLRELLQGLSHGWQRLLGLRVLLHWLSAIRQILLRLCIDTCLALLWIWQRGEAVGLHKAVELLGGSVWCNH